MTDALTVATYNLYQGTGLLSAYAAESVADMAELLRDAYGRMEKTDFPARAAVIADLLAAHRPDVLGLQEVARWERGPDDRCDFLSVLLGELNRVGLPYRAAAVDVTSTLLLHTGGERVGITDRDALLVRTDVPAERLAVGAAGQHVFTSRLELPLPSGLVLPKLRGWGWVDLTVDGQPVRVVNTHLEAFDGGIREAQAEELLAALDACGRPVVVLGDFNASPDEATYALFRERGYADAWTRVHGPEGGHTGLQSARLDNEDSELSQRIDYVLYRAADLDVRSATLVGHDADARLACGRWPSDHAGVLATFAAAAPGR